MSGLSVGVKMDLGSASVADAYFPVGNFASGRDIFESEPALLTLPPDAPGAATALAYPSTYGWRLKYPLFIPAGKTLNCVVRALGQVNYGVRVDVAYIGRTWDVTKPLPKTVRVPWASSYESKNFDFTNAATATTDAATTLDLTNPFSQPLEIDRLSGRIAIVYNKTYGNLSTDSNPVNEDPIDFRLRLLNMTMRSSRGFDIIRTPVRFGSIFPPNWPTWIVPGSWAMAPNEFYRVALQTIASNMNEAVYTPDRNVARAQASVGLVGYRNVPVEAL
jgi:hypothetical protein